MELQHSRHHPVIAFRSLALPLVEKWLNDGKGRQEMNTEFLPVAKPQLADLLY